MPPARRLLAVLTILCTAVALAAPAAASAGGSCANADAEPSQASRAAFERATVCLLNHKRQRYGLRRLARDRRLSRAAHSHASDMVRTRYFAHVSRRGRDVGDRLARTGYTRGASWWLVGENLAWGAGSLSTPRLIMSAWMKSPGHRANILRSEFREVGVAVAFGAPVSVSSRAATYTTTFGARR